MHNQRLILTNAKYFDPIKGNYLENQAIVTGNRKILWVGNMSEFEKQENDTILDQSGNYILPGLIDCHVHLGITFKFAQNMAQEMMRMKNPINKPGLRRK